MYTYDTIRSIVQHNDVTSDSESTKHDESRANKEILPSRSARNNLNTLVALPVMRVSTCSREIRKKHMISEDTQAGHERVLTPVLALTTSFGSASRIRRPPQVFGAGAQQLKNKMRLGKCIVAVQETDPLVGIHAASELRGSGNGCPAQEALSHLEIDTHTLAHTPKKPWQTEGDRCLNLREAFLACGDRLKLHCAQNYGMNRADYTGAGRCELINGSGQERQRYVGGGLIFDGDVQYEIKGLNSNSSSAWEKIRQRTEEFGVRCRMQYQHDMNTKALTQPTSEDNENFWR
eukprot:jgi/Bigna1/76014/fgenesh1_pg.38_\